MALSEELGMVYQPSFSFLQGEREREREMIHVTAQNEYILSSSYLCSQRSRYNSFSGYILHVHLTEERCTHVDKGLATRSAPIGSMRIT